MAAEKEFCDEQQQRFRSDSDAAHHFPFIKSLNPVEFFNAQINGWRIMQRRDFWIADKLKRFRSDPLPAIASIYRVRVRKIPAIEFGLIPFSTCGLESFI
ncbi:hypothetical protein M569_10406 [Genlisea aurea]|uniref:Uncharacterized protein n=1 Tax=Genlisea aurea TaxID=192259 RepID=S8CIB1_9LAMI|nr:hypothetical protein M569_10406 [Genlisea aurea]